MSRSRAEEKATRVAVLGASTPSGALVREALANQRVASARVDLFGDVEGDAVLSEYGGEARLVQAPDPAEVLAHDLIFVCEPGAVAAKAIAAAGDGRLVLDLVGAAPLGSSPIVHPEINPDAARGHRGVLRVPHAIACVLAEVLAPVERALGVAQAIAFVLRPASDFGEAGLEELRDQTLSLLRFEDPPRAAFGGRQLAFNVIAQSALGDAAEPSLEERIASEVAAVLGWTEPRLSVRLAVAPVFHGHAATLRIVTRDDTSGTGPAAAALAETDGLATPLEAEEAGRTSVARVTRDGLGGFWLEAIAGRASARSAARAVQLARAAGGL